MTAVLQLAEQNKIDLYCPVAEYLPEFQYMKVADEFNWDRFPYQIPDSSAKCHLAHRQIRIIDLMTMTAGMHYNTAAKELLEIREKQYKTASTRDVVRKMAEFPLVAEQVRTGCMDLNMMYWQQLWKLLQGDVWVLS